MNNIAKIIVEDYPKNTVPYQFALLSASAIETPNPMPCFKEFSELIFCLNKTNDYSKCGEKYEVFTECFKKFSLIKGYK
tara:strand:+ start:727 stop:963 length:237 start_codon:yes stop_codon:yes gene_type:complete